MSYAYEFSRRALTQFQALEPWIAEETLDELERLISQPPIPLPNKAPGGFVHDFVRQRGAQTVYVFLTFQLFPRRELLRITTLGTHIRSA